MDAEVSTAWKAGHTDAVTFARFRQSNGAVLKPLTYVAVPKRYQTDDGDGYHQDGWSFQAHQYADGYAAGWSEFVSQSTV